MSFMMMLLLLLLMNVVVVVVVSCWGEEESEGVAALAQRRLMTVGALGKVELSRETATFRAGFATASGGTRGGEHDGGRIFAGKRRCRAGAAGGGMQKFQC